MNTHELQQAYGTEPTSCPCTCHKPKHAARPPHPLTMAGR